MAEITDAQVAVLRAFLTGDQEERRRPFAAPDPIDEQPGFAMLGAAAFCEALERRFSKDHSTGEVIRFVASVRARYGKRAADLDPSAAERLVRAVLDGDPSRAAELDDAAQDTQVPLLRQLVVEEQLDDRGLDAFLSRARERAEHIGG